MAETFVKEANFSGKHVCVLGFGLEGKNVCSFLLEHGATVTVVDERERTAFLEETLISFESEGVEFVFGALPSLLSFDVVVRSPGVPVTRHQIVEASEAGVLVTSATKIFFDLCPAKIIGVSGTKGKGTTSTLIFEMLKRAGRDVYLAGNIGEPMLSLLPHLTPESIVVLELSSFQLSDLHVSPHIAVLLMVVPEHMDYHVDFSEYIEAKRNLVRYQVSSDYAIFNHDYPASNESDILTTGHVLSISREVRVEGCYIDKGVIFTRLNGVEERVLSVADVRLVGAHNLDNACAAVLVAKICGVGVGDIVRVLKEFGGLAHRLELVREFEGVAYYNDSFSTIPETTIAAIEAFEQPKVLILGGSSKNSNFEELGRIISEANVRAIIGIGEEWERIQLQVQSEQLEVVEGKKNMKEIVAAARSVAHDGDVVLLSPACASFGMFRDYKERGDLFKQEVLRLR